MTNEQAIKVLQSIKDFREPDLTYALEIGIEAIKKQIPKKPEHYDDTEYFYIECPVCNRRFDSRLKYSGCPYCLQAISLSTK